MGAHADEEALVAALREGDEAAFRALVRRHTPLMRRIARAHVHSEAVADEVVQDTWLAVIRGLERFEGRSALRTWILQILVNRARTRAQREARSVPFSSHEGADDPGATVPAVDPARFLASDHPRWPGHWSAAPEPWPEDRVLAREALTMVLSAIRDLPPRQQQVILLRDVEQWDAADVARALGLTEGNQRVLLHRARSRLRERLEGAWT